MRDDDEANQQPADAEQLKLGRDWITLWHSELAALSVDREAQEAWRKLIGHWAGAAEAVLAAAERGAAVGSGERAARRARSAASQGAAAGAAAPDARDSEIARLRARIDALERRLADVERDRRPALGGADRGAGELAGARLRQS